MTRRFPERLAMMRGNRGQVLMLVGVLLAALVGFAALGIDVAYMYSVRHELQRCADSAALAGASWFIDNSVPGPVDNPESRAREFAYKDAVAKVPLTASEVQVFPSLPGTDNQVRVDTQRTVNLFFAIIFGQATRSIASTATARAGPGHDPDNTARNMVWLVNSP